jgi:hypothetical protein
MNFYTVAARIEREIAKAKTHALNAGHTIDVADTFGDAKATIEMAKAKRIMERGIDLMLMFRDVAASKGLTNERANGTYLITVRPNEGHDFATFYDTVRRFVDRKTITNFTLTFEQKGTSDETLGHGMHVHIVAVTTCRSKGELLRAAISTFKHLAADNCVDVKLCRTPKMVVDNYFVAYQSDDGHKEATREWDALWRSRLGVQPLYENELPPVGAISLTSPGRLIAFE